METNQKPGRNKQKRDQGGVTTDLGGGQGRNKQKHYRQNLPIIHRSLSPSCLVYHCLIPPIGQEPSSLSASLSAHSPSFAILLGPSQSYITFQNIIVITIAFEDCFAAARKKMIRIVMTMESSPQRAFFILLYKLAFNYFFCVTTI